MEQLCKIIGGLLVVTGSACLGISINRGLELRTIELRKLYSILLQLKSEMQYMGNTLPECFSRLSEGASPPFLEWLIGLSERLEREEGSIFYNVWLEELEKLAKASCLQMEDIELLKELADKLGCADISAQLKAIDYVLLHIEESRTKLEGELKDKKKVVASLSLFVGMLTLIMLL